MNKIKFFQELINTLFDTPIKSKSFNFFSGTKISITTKEFVNNVASAKGEVSALGYAELLMQHCEQLDEKGLVKFFKLIRDDFEITSEESIANDFGSVSTKIGLKPFCNTEDISEIQVSDGTITSPPSGKRILSTAIVNRLAEDPELTKTLYFTPSHFDHSSSKAFTYGPLVRIGSSFFKCSMTASKSSRNILLRIKGYFIITS